MEISPARLYDTKDNGIKGGFQLSFLKEGFFYPSYSDKIDTSIIIKKSNLMFHSPNFKLGETVRVKTKEEFSRHFKVEEPELIDGYYVKTRCFFSVDMNKFSGRGFKIKSILEEGIFLLEGCRGHLNEGYRYYPFDADMLIKEMVIFKEV